MNLSVSVVLSLVVAILGLVVYYISVGKTSEAGRILFFAGILAFLLHFGGDVGLSVHRGQ